MATYPEALRQGLPRTPGAEGWPSGGVRAQSVQVVAESQDVRRAIAEDTAQDASSLEAGLTVPVVPPASGDPATAVGQALRQGLPRVAGGEPWPTGGVAPPSATGMLSPAVSTAVKTAALSTDSAMRPEVRVEAAVNVEIPAEPSDVPTAAVGDAPLRRGLPRVAGRDPWPAAGYAPVTSQSHGAQLPGDVVRQDQTVPPANSGVDTPAAVPADVPLRPREGLTSRESAERASEAALPAEPAPASAAPATAQAKPERAVKPKREPIMIGEKTLAQWVKIGILGVVGAIVAAGILVLAARGVTTLPGVPEWLERYPGEYALPETAEPGFPWWARWSHFLNIFLMVLIIRSGILVRQQQKPPAFFTPKRGGKKISINLWLHTSLDVLWLVNGVIFVVMLFVSGHWMRIVPTSWEVFPNALSAMLQYMTLDWPAEHGWVNYNSLQQIMYFVIIFVAAPIAAITGVRMSEWWPQNAEKLNRVYPAPLARALHFPTMLFFVLFIMVHVFLVFSTGALRNLNHMFAGTDVVNWTGFWFFALAIFLTAGGWTAARPLVLAPIASLFGKVSNR